MTSSLPCKELLEAGQLSWLRLGSLDPLRQVFFFREKRGMNYSEVSSFKISIRLDHVSKVGATYDVLPSSVRRTFFKQTGQCLD